MSAGGMSMTAGRRLSWRVVRMRPGPAATVVAAGASLGDRGWSWLDAVDVGVQSSRRPHA